MSPDTPLAQVCEHLPRETAQMLMHAAPSTVNVTLIAIRQLLCELEENGRPLDPISLDIVLSHFAMHIAGLHSMVIVATTNTGE